MSLLPSSGILVGVLVLALVAHRIGFTILRDRARGAGKVISSSLVTHTRRPVQVMLSLIFVEIAVALVRLPGSPRAIVLHALGICLIFAVAWLAVQLISVLDDVTLSHYQVGTADNLKARRIQTQITVLRRVAIVVVTVVAIAIALLTFAQVRAAGAGLLASAGLVAVIGAVAAKPAATNLVAGIQIAISQPIRVDDVVVVDGHWGRVEDIALTYVVIRVWDLRRLVVPISYLIENSFENWTRASADILGWVHLEVDYTAPVDAIRQRLHEILAASPDWDTKVWNLQVTGLGPSTMQLRALMSSTDSSSSWSLQCEVREKLVEFLQLHHPGALPRLRSELGWQDRQEQVWPDPSLEDVDSRSS